MTAALERWEAVSALPPAIPASVLEEAAQSQRSLGDGETAERVVTRAVELRLLGDLTSFDGLPAPVRAVAMRRFENALAAGLLSPSVRLSASITGAPVR